MSKHHEWDQVFHGKGVVICNCDFCMEQIEHEYDGGSPDYRGAQDTIESNGWISRKIRGSWYDFCCEEHYIRFIQEKLGGS